MSRLPLRPLAGLVVASIIFAAGCSHDLEAAAKPCTDASGCPQGQSCVSGQCLAVEAGVKPDGLVVDAPGKLEAGAPEGGTPKDMGPDVAKLDSAPPDLKQDGPAPDSAPDQQLTDSTPVDLALVDQAVVDQAIPLDQAVVDQAIPLDQTVVDQTIPPDQMPTPDQTVCAKVGDICDDGNACTHTDKCTGVGVGVCAGQTLNCNDFITCTTDTCMGVPYAQGGCKNELKPGYCRINGTCMTSGSKGNTCEVCDPLFSPQAWAPDKGQNCVITLTGSKAGHMNGTLTSALFNNPTGVAIDTAGVIYVADWKNQRIRKIEKGMVSTLAGDGTQGTIDATGTAARFYEPFDVDVDSSTGTVYVAQMGASSAGQQAFIRKITKAGVVTTFAGGGSGVLLNGSALAWRLWKPKGVAVGLQGQVYAIDTMHHVITEITGTQIKLLAGVLTSKGDQGLKGKTDGPLLQSKFQYPSGLALAPGGVVYVADTGNGLLRKMVLGGSVTTVATGIADITDVAVDMSSGKVYVSQGQVNITTPGHNIFVVDPFNKTKTKLAGQNNKGSANGPGATAYLNDPVGLAVDANGYLLIADRGNSRIRVLNPK